MAKNGAKKGGYFQVLDAIYEADLTAHERTIFIYLSRRANIHAVSFPCHERMAKDCNVSRSTVKKALGGLEAKQFITIDHQQGRTNLYRISDEWQVKTKKSPSAGVVTEQPGVVTEQPGVVTEQPGVGAQQPGVGAIRLQKDNTYKDDTYKDNTYKDPEVESVLQNMFTSDGTDALVTEFYACLGTTTLTDQTRARGRQSVEKLLDSGFTTEDIRYAIRYTFHIHNANKPIESIGILPYTIENAKVWKRRRNQNQLLLFAARDSLTESQKTQQFDVLAFVQCCFGSGKEPGNYLLSLVDDHFSSAEKEREGFNNRKSAIAKKVALYLRDDYGIFRLEDWVKEDRQVRQSCGISKATQFIDILVNEDLAKKK